MKKSIILLIIIGGILIWILMSTQNTDKAKTDMKDYELTEEELIKHIELAINPEFKNWILFKNGTYIIIEDTFIEDEIKKEGLDKMKEFGPVHVGG